MRQAWGWKSFMMLLFYTALSYVSRAGNANPTSVVALKSPRRSEAFDLNRGQLISLIALGKGAKLEVLLHCAPNIAAKLSHQVTVVDKLEAHR